VFLIFYILQAVPPKCRWTQSNLPPYSFLTGLDALVTR